MKEKIGIGIIGTGFARRVQIPAFLECEGAEIVSVASGHLANAEATANEFKIRHFTDDWRETVDNADVDLVCITTPPNTHFEMTIRALENGKHILGEKPMAMNAEEARKMTEKAREKNVLALIDHELRFLHGRRVAFEMLRNGEIGKIRHAKANFRAPQRGDSSLPWNWWSDKSTGGGTLGAVVSHSIDSLFWFLGAEISEVFCQLQTHIKQRKTSNGELRDVTTDDEANLILRFADSDLTTGATATVSASMIEYPKYQNRMEFFGTKGAIRVDYLGEVFVGKVDNSDWQQIETKRQPSLKGIFDSGFPGGFMAFAPKIIEAIREGKTEIEYAATFEDGLRVQKILDAAHESNETGYLVRI